MFSFESITPFGTPVVPPVLSITATASFSKATFSAFVPLPCFMKSCHFKYLPLSGSGCEAPSKYDFFSFILYPMFSNKGRESADETAIILSTFISSIILSIFG